MTAPRIVVKGATFSVTRRTTLRKAFLAPWHPDVNEAWLYSLAYAQSKEETRFDLHLGSTVINHQHLNLTLRKPNLGEILRLTHCAFNTLLAREKYDAPKYLWDKRSTHAMRDIDAAAQAISLTYTYLNTVAAGLVDRPEHMPVRVLDFGLWKTGGLWVKRPDFYFSEERPEKLWLSVTPPPLLLRAFDGDLEALVHHLQRMTEEGIRALSAERKRAPMGAAKLREIHPWMEPKTLAESGGDLVPVFKVGAGGLVGRRMEGQCAVEVTDWRGEHEGARLARLAGKEAVFPYGTYGFRVFHNAPVAAEPWLEAIVSAPGPLLEDVLKEVAERPTRTPDLSARGALLDQVRGGGATKPPRSPSTTSSTWTSRRAHRVRARSRRAPTAERSHRPSAPSRRSVTASIPFRIATLARGPAGSSPSVIGDGASIGERPAPTHPPEPRPPARGARRSVSGPGGASVRQELAPPPDHTGPRAGSASSGASIRGH